MTEPPVPPLPPSPYPPAAPPPATATVRIGDWLSGAWTVLQPFWLEAVLAIWVVILARLAGILLCILPGLIIIGPLIGGVHIYFGKRLLGLPAEVGDIRKGFRRFGDTFLVGLVIYLVPFLINVVLAVPRILAIMAVRGHSEDLAGPMMAFGGCLGALGGLFTLAYVILANTFLLFAMPLVVFRGMPAMDAMRASVERVKPQVAGFLVLLVVNYLLGLAGLLGGFALLCIGWLVTIPLAMSLVALMQLEAYRDFFGLQASDLAPYMD